MAFHSDYHDYLFKSSEIAALLESAGFPLPALTHNTGDQPTPAPQWMRIYAAKSALRTYEAAFILAGKEPPDFYPKTHYIGADERRILRAIEDSVLIGDLDTKNTQWHIDDEPQTWLIDHQSVIEWCQRAGYEWPLSQFIEPAQTDSERRTTPDRPARAISQQDQDVLNMELASLRQEVEDLRTTVEELKKLVPLHPGHLMGKAIEAQHKYWQDPKKRPKAEVIIGELREQYPDLSEAQIKAIEKIACPIERNGRQ